LSSRRRPITASCRSDDIALSLSDRARLNTPLWIHGLAPTTGL
jgi:hypothetical protein